MNKQNPKPLLPLLFLVVVPVMAMSLFGCAATTETKPDQPVSYLNEYPTQDRVEFVLQCIEKHGGLRYENLYSCNCSIDKMASQMSFKDYTEANTFTFLRSMPGENGSVFRDPPKAKELRKKLIDAKDFAEKSCFIK